MDTFFSDMIQEGQVILDEDESRHCSKVLRKMAGDLIRVIDGAGRAYECQIAETGKRHVTARILQVLIQVEDTPKVNLHLAIAPTKNADRIEWLVEKSVEMGVGRITLLQCRNSERHQVRVDRLQKIAVSALKQSQQFWLPEIRGVIPFIQFIQTEPVTSGNAFIAHCYKSDKESFKIHDLASECVILIGPEGDFSEEEVMMAKEKGYRAIDLGDSRLRTETAGMYAVAAYRFMRS